MGVKKKRLYIIARLIPNMVKTCKKSTIAIFSFFHSNYLTGSKLRCMNFFTYETANSATEKTILDLKNLSGLNIDFEKLLGQKNHKKIPKFKIGKDFCKDFKWQTKRTRTLETIKRIERCFLEEDHFRFDFSIPETYEPTAHSQNLTHQSPQINSSTRFDSSLAVLLRDFYLQDCQITANVYSILHNFLSKKRSEYLKAVRECPQYPTTFEIQDKSSLNTYDIIFCINLLLHSIKDQNTKGILMYPSKVVMTATGDYRVKLYYTNKISEYEDLRNYSDFKTFLDQEMSKNDSYFITEAILNDYIALKKDELGYTKDEVNKAVYNAFNIVAKFQSLYSSFSFYNLGINSENRADLILFNLPEHDKYSLRTLGFGDDITDPFYSKFFIVSNTNHITVDSSICPQIVFRQKINHLNNYFLELYHFCSKACEIFDIYISAVPYICFYNFTKTQLKSMIDSADKYIYQVSIEHNQPFLSRVHTILQEQTDTVERLTNEYHCQKMKDYFEEIKVNKHDTVEPSWRQYSQEYATNNQKILNADGSTQSAKIQTQKKIAEIHTRFEENIIKAVKRLTQKDTSEINNKELEEAFAVCNDLVNKVKLSKDESRELQAIRRLYMKTIYDLMQVCHEIIVIASKIPAEFEKVTSLMVMNE